ncbi:hypothetical protein GY45DRAFT_1275661 [Cubamyces sp. BRFM 1775]|nr:hypothetical protein GY45DRAFT_1275661 [Cubamyces sp. BRFM 1775]
MLILEPWGLSLFLICIPFAWVAHWNVESWGHEAQFVSALVVGNSVCFLSIMSLQNIFESCGDQLALRVGKDLSELICISFRNCVEATLAFILLRRCHLRLLQSTIIGVVVLHLLLVQGTAFFIGGSQIVKQHLSKHHVSINPSLLMIGVLSVVIPTAFFVALDRGDNAMVIASPPAPLVGDRVRDWILKTSHAVAIMLLIVYVISRVHRHLWSLSPQARAKLPQWLKCFLPTASESSVADEEHAPKREQTKDADLVPRGVCAFIIIVSIVVMSVTAEFLVDSIDPVRERYNIQAEFFGLILLPLVSFLPEGMVALFKFLSKFPRYALLNVLPERLRPAWSSFYAKCCKTKAFNFMSKLQIEMPPEPDARGTPIDSSIQFLLWWMPFVILVGWWIGKPIHLLFDYFEVALLLGTCFLVNHVTADGETNFAEGFTMITFYAMVATAAWFYPGQSQVGYMLSCPESVAAAVASGVQNALVLH